MSEPQDQGKVPDKLTFHYIKSTQFRVIHVDGGFGAVGPAGRNIHLSLFSERLPVPQQTTYGVTAEGSLGSELLDQRITRSGLIRELEVDAVFDLETARALHGWLADKIAYVEALQTGKEKK